MSVLFKAGMVHVYYGDGKGKTSSVVGLAARVSGCGGRVLFAQFLKNGMSGELKALRAMAGVDVLEGKPCTKFVRDMSEAERAEAALAQRKTLALAADRAFSAGYDLLVLDEVIDIIDLGFIPPEDLLRLLREKPATLEIAVTGHRVYPELLDVAGYVSEIKKIKHPYDSGIKARRGAEF